MRTIEVNLYQFDELSESAKEKAREWYRNISVDCENLLEDHEEDFETVGNLLGIEFDKRSVPRMDGKVNQHPKIWYSGFSSQGDGLCFEGTYSYVPANKIREYAPQDEELHRIADKLAEIQSLYNYQIHASITHQGRYYSASINCSVNDSEIDENGNEIEKELFASDDDMIQQLLRDLMRWMYRRLESDYEWRNSDEVVDDNIRANEYEFTENGDRY